MKRFKVKQQCYATSRFECEVARLDVGEIYEAGRPADMTGYTTIRLNPNVAIEHLAPTHFLKELPEEDQAEAAEATFAVGDAVRIKLTAAIGKIVTVRQRFIRPYIVQCEDGQRAEWSTANLELVSSAAPAMEEPKVKEAPKFKVDDRVKVNKGRLRVYGHINVVFTINGVDSYIVILGNGSRGYCRTDELELAPVPAQDELDASRLLIDPLGGRAAPIDQAEALEIKTFLNGVMRGHNTVSVRDRLDACRLLVDLQLHAQNLPTA